MTTPASPLPPALKLLEAFNDLCEDYASHTKEARAGDLREHTFYLWGQFVRKMSVFTEDIRAFESDRRALAAGTSFLDPSGKNMPITQWQTELDRSMTPDRCKKYEKAKSYLDEFARCTHFLEELLHEYGAPVHSTITGMRPELIIKAATGQTDAPQSEAPAPEKKRAGRPKKVQDAPAVDPSPAEAPVSEEKESGPEDDGTRPEPSPEPDTVPLQKADDVELPAKEVPKVIDVPAAGIPDDPEDPFPSDGDPAPAIAGPKKSTFQQLRERTVANAA